MGKEIKYDLNQRRLEMLEWAIKHELIIDPFRGMDFHIKDFAQTGYCPYDKEKKRTSCPCIQSLYEDIPVRGRCLCSLFWKPQTAHEWIQKLIKDQEELLKLEEGYNEQRKGKKIT